MRLRNAILITITTYAMTSCFKDEPLNAECDIETAMVHVDAPLEMFFQASDTLINVVSSTDSIGFGVRRQADLSSLAPTFTLTDGATISPANGSTHDFSKGAVTYTVTSEDGQWHRTYKVAFVPKTRTVNDTLRYGFDKYAMEEGGKYYTWNTDTESGLQTDKWATANPGFSIARSSAQPDEYPTIPLADGMEGAAVRLVTRSTGGFGAMRNMRLAAGNFFLGTFDAKKALTNTLESTNFGVPFDRKPLTFSGYYRYHPGETFQDKDGKAVGDKTDCASIYSIVYINHDSNGNPIVLHGDNVKTSPQVVAIAELPASEVLTTDEWKHFELQYVYKKDIDPDLLENYGYSMSIIFSSSDNGAYFEGAIGSTLDIDNVSVVCEKTE